MHPDSPIPSRPPLWHSPTFNVETANVETANVETASVETASVETASVEIASVEIASVETAIALVQARDWPVLEQWLAAHSSAPLVLPTLTTSSSAYLPAQLPPAMQRPLQLALQIWITGEFDVRWQLAKVLIVWGDPAIAALCALLQDEQADLELRWFTARTLGEAQHPLGIQTLVGLLDSPHAELAAIAAQSLVKLGPEAIAALVPLLAQPAGRLLAVQALAQIRHSQTIAPLITVIQDPDAQIRSISLEALSTFKHQPLMPMFAHALNDPVAAVRIAGLEGLSLRPQWLEPGMLAQIIDKLWDPNFKVVQQAANALGRIAAGVEQPADAKPADANLPQQACQALIHTLGQPHNPPPLQAHLIQVLAWCAHPQALAAFADWIDRHPPSPTHHLVYRTLIPLLGRWPPISDRPQALSVLLSLPPLPPDLTRLWALALGDLDLEAARDPLVDLLASGEPSVQLHAIAALKALNLDGTRSHLERLGQDRQTPPALRQGIATALREW
jgi:HEAT repeat protein